MRRDAPCPHSSMHLSGQTRWSALGNACEPEADSTPAAGLSRLLPTETPWLCAPPSPTVCPCQRLRTYSGPACRGWAVTLSTHAVPTRRRRAAIYQEAAMFRSELVTRSGVHYSSSAQFVHPQAARAARGVRHLFSGAAHERSYCVGWTARGTHGGRRLRGSSRARRSPPALGVRTSIRDSDRSHRCRAGPGGDIRPRVALGPRVQRRS